MCYVCDVYKYIVFLSVWSMSITDLLADVVTLPVTGTKSFLENTIIAENVNVLLDNLNIQESIIVENYGVLQADNVNVCSRCNVYFENYNTIDFGNVVLNDNARVFQLVSSLDNMVAANFSADYSIKVSGDNNLNLADVVDFATDANSIVLENVTLRINQLPLNHSMRVEIGNNVKFIIDDIDALYNVAVLDNVTGGNAVRFVSNDDDVMFVTTGEIINKSLCLKRVRETDYSVIFDEELGGFINSLREDNKNNKLMHALDSAVDKDSLCSVMGRSALFNPDVLYDSLQIVNAVNMLGVDKSLTDGLNVSGFGVLSDDFYMYGADIAYGISVSDKLNMNLSLVAGSLEYASDLDEMSGVLYGVNFNAKYLFSNDVFMRVGLGTSIIDFNTDYVFYDGVVKNKATVLEYGIFDAGYDIKSDSFSVTPFVGLGMQFYDINGFSYRDYMLRSGLNAEYKYTMSDLAYVYGASVVADTKGTLSATGRLGFESTLDMIGGYIDLSVISMNETLSYKTSVNARIMF
ncbi:MAG: hypothetical protein IKZ34_02870 [Alphaproteobacteria bacterium]|nr:hypothetical protein [Alphaproteobacteria bacterium]